MNQGDLFQHQFFANQKIYDGFISIFQDKNPLHIDKNFAVSKGFSDVVMHGNILGGFLSYFIGECLPTKNVMIISQKMDYHAPFFIGDCLDFEAKIDAISQSVGMVDFKFVFKNQQQERIAKGSIQIKLLK